jgi:tRNA (guanine37-N1)-methyltransferase
MRIDVLTLFPDMVREPLRHSIVARAATRGVADLRFHDLRDWTTDRRRTADDTPYGGGAGMVMAPRPLVTAIRTISAVGDTPPLRILMCPQGEILTQRRVRELATHPRLLLVCGHYEGVDERVRISSIDREISIGDFVLSGGEVAAVVVIDAIVRLLPGALGSPESALDDSHSASDAPDLLEYPHFTRPPEYEGIPVPDVLRSGHHAHVEAWRRAQAVERTRVRRPDLYARWWVHEQIARSEAPAPKQSRRRPPPTAPRR